MKYTISQPQSFFERGQRDNQEDAMFPSLGAATIDSRTFVVCDGMGGLKKGEVASSRMVKYLGRWFQEKLPKILL